MAQNAMLRQSSHMRALRSNQLAPSQPFQGDLHRAFGKAGSFRDHSQAGADWPPSLSLCRAIKMKVNEKSGWLMVVPNQVGHQNIENIIIDRDRPAETRHR
jgi:hypothetical protein